VKIRPRAGHTSPEREAAAAFRVHAQLRSNRKVVVLRLMMIILAIGLPLIAHAAVMSHSGSLTIASLAVLALLVMLPRLVRWSVPTWCAVPIVVGAFVLLWRAHAAWLPLYLTPVIVNFFVAWIFGHTLAPGRVPLVERLARLMHDSESLHPDIVRYARSVTLAWTLLTFGLGMLNLVLALIAEPSGILALLGITPPITVSVETWSLFANCLDYLIAGGFFIAEYFYRDARFPDHPYRNLLDFLRRAAAVGPRVLGARHD
jgi:uncharacterized membrane protein